jgi:hypothetical protein
MTIPIILKSCLHVAVPSFQISEDLVGVKCYSFVVFKFISLSTNEFEFFSKFLQIVFVTWNACSSPLSPQPLWVIFFFFLLSWASNIFWIWILCSLYFLFCGVFWWTEVLNIIKFIIYYLMGHTFEKSWIRFFLSQGHKRSYFYVFF